MQNVSDSHQSSSHPSVCELESSDDDDTTADLQIDSDLAYATQELHDELSDDNE